MGLSQPLQSLTVSHISMGATFEGLVEMALLACTEKKGDVA